jgi:nicotinamide phosphoribosyltransferase
MKTRFRELTEVERQKYADVDYFRHLFMIYPEGIVSVVSDTFDYWNTITNTAKTLKDEIMARNGKVVFRPDTGDPVRVVVGDEFETLNGAGDLDSAKKWALDLVISRVEAETAHGEYGGDDHEQIFEYYGEYYKAKVYISWNRHDKQYYYTDRYYSKLESFEKVELTPEQKGSIQCLWEVFGGTVTEKGYKQLDSHVGLIYGDSITIERAKAICEGLKKKGFASTNLVYGIGSYTYQYVTRDTDGYAVKATWAQIKGESKEIFKAPKTDDGTKKSAKGLTAVFKNEAGEFYLKDQATWDEVNNCELKPVFENGKLLKDWTLAEVRANLAQY